MEHGVTASGNRYNSNRTCHILSTRGLETEMARYIVYSCQLQHFLVSSYQVRLAAMAGVGLGGEVMRLASGTKEAPGLVVF